MKILAIIPARGGSKGIPKKNIRLMNGKPLIFYSISVARASRFVTDVVVSTDSSEISTVARTYGAGIIMRGQDLSADMITLDPVVDHAKKKIEKLRNIKYDVVVTIQPTSPLLSVKTLDNAIEYFLKHNYDTVISVINRPHLSWGRDNQGVAYPLFNERKNRQELPAHYMETGAFVITRGDVVKENTRIGVNVSVFEVPECEYIDIDDKDDWLLAENIMKRKRIIFRADGYAKLGMGHVYNCITMAFSLIEHEVLIVINENSTEGIEKIKETNLNYKVFGDEEELDGIIRTFKPDVWVNDCLDTTKEYIEHIKGMVNRVVSIEDLGSGGQVADAVINALYEDNGGKNVYSGWRYVCLRDEFQIQLPKPFSYEVRNIMIMFGGTDPANLNLLIYNMILRIAERYPNITFNFITGIGYDCKKQKVVSQPDKNIYVYPNVLRVTDFMRKADLAITSQGRAIFEFAAMGVPSIVLSQNKRETSHNFARLENGFINLGLGNETNEAVIENTLAWLISTTAIRKNMHEIMVNFPLRSGVNRVKKIILGDNDE